MDNQFRQQILNEAIRIGDELLSQAEQDENGISWKTMGIDFNDNNRVIWRTLEVVYNGVSGIVLFLLELYKTTGDEKYLQAAIEGMRWVERYCQDNPTNYYAFYSGRMGVAYCMLKMAEVTKTNEYLEKALKIAKPCSAFLEMPGAVNDLLNGTSGTILGLLHLHAATGEKWILATLDSFVRDLIEKAHHGPVGLYWDRSHQYIRGLCGFSHGAAGIGFVFLELGHYFNNEAFYWMAEQAFLYESHFYNEANKNWPDFRRSFSNEKEYIKHKQAFISQNFDFFTKPYSMTTWCHGAPGIGISRLRAYKLIRKKVYFEQAEFSVTTTIRKTESLIRENRSCNLCHGISGNAELFLQAYQTVHKEQYLDLAVDVCSKLLSIKKSGLHYNSGNPSAGNLEDRSLFLGNAGVGHFYLRTLNPHTVPSILAPMLKSRVKPAEHSKYEFLSIKTAELLRHLLSKDFKRTITACEVLLQGKNVSFVGKTNQDWDGNPVQILNRTVDQIRNMLSPDKQLYLDNVHRFELKKLELDHRVKSFALSHIKECVIREEAQELLNLTDNEFLELRLSLDTDVVLVNKVLNLNESVTQSQEKDLAGDVFSDSLILLRPAARGIVEEELHPLSQILLLAFRDGGKVGDVAKNVANLVEMHTKAEKEKTQKLVIEQIVAALSSGLLTRSFATVGTLENQ